MRDIRYFERQSRRSFISIQSIHNSRRCIFSEVEANDILTSSYKMKACNIFRRRSTPLPREGFEIQLIHVIHITLQDNINHFLWCIEGRRNIFRKGHPQTQGHPDRPYSKGVDCRDSTADATTTTMYIADLAENNKNHTSSYKRSNEYEKHAAPRDLPRATIRNTWDTLLR